MQVTVESTDKLERRLKVQVPSATIEEEIRSRLAKVRKTAKIKGFRPGKVPANVVRQQFGGQVRREVLGEVMQSSFIQAVQEQQLNPAGGPRFEPGDLGQGRDLEYTATFEVYPDIELVKIEGLAVARRQTSVEDADVEGMLERLRVQRAEWRDVDREARTGDQIVIDFTGRIDGETFTGGSGRDYPTVVGAGSLLKDLEDGLVGLRVNDQKLVEVTFPDDYHASELAGKTAQFDVTAKAVKEQALPELDAEFVTSFGVEGGDLDEFRAQVRANMEREAHDKGQAELRRQILAALIEANPVELPKVLVEQEIEHLQRDSTRKFGIADATTLPREPFEEQARQRVALGLLVGEIMRAKDITADRDRVAERVAAMADGDPGATSEIRGNRDMMHQIEMMVLEEQVVEKLIEDATIKNETVSFADLMDVK